MYPGTWIQTKCQSRGKVQRLLMVKLSKLNEIMIKSDIPWDSQHREVVNKRIMVCILVHVFYMKFRIGVSLPDLNFSSFRGLKVSSQFWQYLRQNRRKFANFLFPIQKVSDFGRKPSHFFNFFLVSYKPFLIKKRVLQVYNSRRFLYQFLQQTFKKVSSFRKIIKGPLAVE